MGDSFAAGTTDGPGAFNFKQDCNSFLYHLLVIMCFACLQLFRCQWDRKSFLEFDRRCIG